MMEAGNLGAARRSLTDALAWSRDSVDVPLEMSALVYLGDLELREGNLAGAVRCLRRATELTIEVGWYERLSRCMDLWAHVLVAQGRPAEAVTIWTARQEAGWPFIDQPLHEKRRREPLDQAVAALRPARAEAARERGAAMTPVTAAEFALLMADAEPEAPVLGLPRLSQRERELVGLVAKGQTDAQIASQLYIAVSTVRSHLDRIRDKTGSRRRADLTRLALQAGLI
jgi:DNA-binding CsgD family transcriptional regulator